MNEETKTGLPDEAPKHSLKLKAAAKEIKDILDKYDIAGIVQMFEPGYNEYAMNISPSFSLVSLNEARELKITDPIEDPAHPEVAKKKIADTVNMMANLRLYIGKLYQVLMQADLTVRGHFNMLPPGTPGGANGVKPGPKPGQPGSGRSKFHK